MTHNEIRTIFDRIAPVYDRFNDWLSLGQHHIWKDMTVKWSGVKPGDTSLDLCCGSGDLSFMLARRVRSTGQVFGVDFSYELLEVARSRAQSQYPRSPITWIEADVLNLPFDDDCFDAVTMGYGLRNVTNIPQSLKEIHRVLKKGAKAAILDFHRPSDPQMRAFQQWYLDNLVVPIANYMGVKDEYAYISPSLDRFPTGAEQMEIGRQVGFTTVTHYPLANGMMGVLVLMKG
ncbi:bifunctional demethylmenaquinone methyltransferase/2-methoxy-6-polyprenyl-1,4-benzoquinol methylase UbiE [Scytonema sp. UIC 10036]|uniref:bifunctional demethylmenaquinone methyltransferase/2-methoxy-6-polyprenyl-1,4-benzoquinol methylase UbiE n=1 Tax=Scytonema sp. UIC 10036 TaxID=2304196 RepID=UPI0012DA93BE|nr:bifunctional demethylmenaquinone methyltransferase/2-methoxy-6-polyprenyl-1,4-benzoquinol methylase UbiE [Scytonema sp. UIC 10036]MUG95268.1 bifunctional demethylmenaquinone methyltransferase/2-methoxy-6-polyprenyl-1,4-benzoquinol methylase UbiE [Scytonema sp. UIC 10036]